MCNKCPKSKRPLRAQKDTTRSLSRQVGTVHQLHMNGHSTSRQKTTSHPQRTRWGFPWPGGRTAVMQSARGVLSPGRGWVGRQEAPLEWRRAAGVELGALEVWGVAAREKERVQLPLLGVGAGVPSSPSWGCKVGYLGGRGKCGAAGAYGDDASAGRRRGCARWGQLNRGHASGCYVWSTPIRCRCQSESQRHHLLHPHQTGISPPHPRCCRDLYCCDAAHPRFSSSRCFGSLWSERKNC